MRDLRSKLRRARRELTSQQQRESAFSVCCRVVTDQFFLSAKRIAFYLPNDGELDPRLLMQNASLIGKRCYLPIVTDRLLRWRDAPMVFQEFDPSMDTLAYNRFHIAEPRYDPARVIAPEMLNVMFLPLVAFDRKGNRLGMGQGFYDRTLASLSRHFHRPRLIGLAYSFQETNEIETHARDIPLDGVATETELIWF